MGKIFFDGRPIFEVSNRKELEEAVAMYKGKVETPYVVQLPNGAKEAWKEAFHFDDTIEVVLLPNTIEEIGREVFMNCSSLTVVHIPDSVKKIESNAFRNCACLAHINIPASVSEIGDNVFMGCASLSKIKVDANNNSFDSRDNCNAIIETKTNTLLYGCANTVIPETVKKIEYGAFFGNKVLKKIKIPESVEEISQDVFWECSGLEEVEGLGSLKEIPNGTFCSCTSLSKISFSDKIEVIDGFSGCTGLHEIIIPNSVVEIKHFAFEGCTSLSKITISGFSKTIAPSAFSRCTGLRVIYCEDPNLREYLKEYNPADVKIVEWTKEMIAARNVLESFRRLGPIDKQRNEDAPLE